jgi:putative addiction module component (TIGR02574 family)
MQIIEAVRKLSVEERAAILEELQDDVGIYEYLANKELPAEALEELKRRDKAFIEGKSKLYTWEEVKAKLSF